MAKCVNCTGYATHKAKGHLMCNACASLMKGAERICSDREIPYCKECKKPLAVLDWNRDVFLHVCDNIDCTQYRRPQDRESKHDALPKRRREEVDTL